MRFLNNKFQPLILLVAAIWIIEVVNLMLGHGLASWGILPRNVGGLVGIPLAPFIHGGFWHAVSNTVPLIVLGGLTLAAGPRRFWSTTVGVILLTGLLVWLIARGAYHVGASGLVFGYFGVLMGRALIERSLLSILIAIATLILYGGMLWGVLPVRSFVSFESHLFGLLAGIAVVWAENKLGGAKPD